MDIMKVGITRVMKSWTRLAVTKPDLVDKPMELEVNVFVD